MSAERFAPTIYLTRANLRSSPGPQVEKYAICLDGPQEGYRFALGATWADRDYMQTYFGVTAAQAQATSFSVYTPKSGSRKVDASVGAEYAMASSWKLQANLAISRLADVAAASPIVGRRNGASAALAVAYEF